MKSKLSKKEIAKLVKTIDPCIFIGNETYEEEFKQVYYLPQGRKRKDGLYLPFIISSFGRVFSIHKDGTLYERKQTIDKNGYNLLVLRFKKKTIGVRPHRLVATAFIKNTHKKRNEVNHIDGIKTHNFVWNLEWVTSSENKKHAMENNLAHFARGENSGKSIYSNEQIENVCRMLEENSLLKSEIAELTGVSQHMVNDIYKGRYWNHISSKYDFTERKNKDNERINRIHTVCKMLEDNKSYKDITNITGLDFREVSDIYIEKENTYGFQIIMILVNIIMANNVMKVQRLSRKGVHCKRLTVEALYPLYLQG